MTNPVGYDLSPKNPDAGKFHFGARSFPVLLEVCGYLFSSVCRGERWYCVFGMDERIGDALPLIGSSEAFEVAEQEARVMARIARNFVVVQRSLPNKNATHDKASYTKVELEKILICAVDGNQPGKWPVKLPTDFVNQFERFAE